MFEAESFTSHYHLTPGKERLLQAVITRDEKVLFLSFAMADRLKEQAAKVGMQLLAASTLENKLIKIYFLASNGVFIKTIKMVSDDPNRDIFMNLLIYKFSQGRQPN